MVVHIYIILVIFDYISYLLFFPFLDYYPFRVVNYNIFFIVLDKKRTCNFYICNLLVLQPCISHFFVMTWNEKFILFSIKQWSMRSCNIFHMHFHIVAKGIVIKILPSLISLHWHKESSVSWHKICYFL